MVRRTYTCECSPGSGFIFFEGISYGVQGFPESRCIGRLRAGSRGYHGFANITLITLLMYNQVTGYSSSHSGHGVCAHFHTITLKSLIAHEALFHSLNNSPRCLRLSSPAENNLYQVEEPSKLSLVGRRAYKHLLGHHRRPGSVVPDANHRLVRLGAAVPARRHSLLHLRLGACCQARTGRRSSEPMARAREGPRALRMSRPRTYRSRRSAGCESRWGSRKRMWQAPEGCWCWCLGVGRSSEDAGCCSGCGCWDCCCRWRLPRVEREAGERRMRSVDGAFAGHQEVLMAVASLGRAAASRECIGFGEVGMSRFYALCQCRLTPDHSGTLTTHPRKS